VQVTGATLLTAMRIVVGFGYMVKTTRDGCTGRVLSGRMIERSGDIVCGLYHAQGDEEHEFLG
jgi:hypothetical protein